MAKLLLLQVGSTFDTLIPRLGDFDRWFQQGLGLSAHDLETVRAHQGAPMPTHHDFRAVVVSGSAAMVTDREPWSEATADYLREAAHRGRPILGVCYGHQLLAHAFGGEVGDNPAGRQTGTVTMALEQDAASDPLFAGLPPSLIVHVSHRQRVLRLPPRAKLVGRCTHDPHHAFRLGEQVWGVQFHPEFDAYITRQYITLRREIIVREGADPDQLIAGVRIASHGTVLLRRFADFAR